MSQYHSMPRFSLSATPLPNKVLISLFLAGTCAALAVAVYAFYQPTGLTTQGVVEFYLGNEGNPDAREIMVEKSRGELLEWIHIHSFSTLLLAFVLCHFIQLTRRGDRAKIVCYLSVFVAWAGMMAGPWLVRFHSPSFAGPLLAAGGVFIAATLWGAGVTLGEMWFGRTSRSAPVSDLEESREVEKVEPPR
ncbi:MAG: hypothetical protein HYY93_14555 [Planctomycetes bacterium]|nr:hypothetical protein [Planctomycetota bacterium]